MKRGRKVKEFVTYRERFFIIFYVIIGYTIVELPSVMAQTVKTGILLVFAVSILIFSTMIYVFGYLNKTFPQKNLFEYSCVVFSKPIAIVFSVVYLALYLILTSISFLYTVKAVKIDFFYNTPSWALGLLFVITCTYAASRGAVTLGRIAEFYGIIITISALCIHFLMFRYGEILEIQPILYVPTVEEVQKCFPYIFMAFTGFEVVSMLPTTKEDGQKCAYSGVMAVVCVGIFYWIVVSSCYMMVGISDIVNYKDALMVAIRRLDVDFLQFLKRLDMLFIIVWQMSMFLATSTFQFFVVEHISCIVPNVNKNKIFVFFAFTLFTLIFFNIKTNLMDKVLYQQHNVFSSIYYICYSNYAITWSEGEKN